MVSPTWVLLVAMGFAGRAAFAADVCPAAKDVATGTEAGVVSWSSQASLVGKRQCVSSGIRNLTNPPAVVEWPDAGIAMAMVRSRLDVAICCFSHESAQAGTLRFGAAQRPVKVATHREVVKPGAVDVDEHEYPDLIEDGARHRTVSIWGTLWADGAPLVVDLLLRCSASRFADQFAYQFDVVSRADEVEIDWDLMKRMQAKVSPNVQPMLHGKVWVFLSAESPVEALATVEVRTKKGTVAGRFQFDGFAMGKR
jgi:hypothetical protein